MRTRDDFGWTCPVAAVLAVTLSTGGAAGVTVCDPVGALGAIEGALPLIDQCIAQLDAAVFHVFNADGAVGLAENELALADEPIELADALTASAATQLAAAGDELDQASLLTGAALAQINDAALHFAAAAGLASRCGPCGDAAQEDLARIQANLLEAAQQSADAMEQYVTSQSQQAMAQSQMQEANQQIFNAKQRRITAAAQLASARQQKQEAQAQLSSARAQRDAARTVSAMAEGQLVIFPPNFARVLQKLQEIGELHERANGETDRANTKMLGAEVLRLRALGHLEQAKADLERAMAKLSRAEADLLRSITETERIRQKKMRIAEKALRVLGQTLTVQAILTDCGLCAGAALAEVATGAGLTQTALDNTLAGLAHDDAALAALLSAQADGGIAAGEVAAAIPPFDAAIGLLGSAGGELNLAITAAADSLNTGGQAAALNDQAIALLIDCPICPWDCAAPADGLVGVLDLLALLGQWSLADTSCDFDGTGVGVVALLQLLGHWGACP